MFINKTGHPLRISIATCIQRFWVWTCQCLPVGGVFSGKPSLFSSTCTFTFIALHSIIWILFTSLFIFLFLWSLLSTFIRATVCKSNSLSEYKTMIIYNFAWEEIYKENIVKYGTNLMTFVGGKCCLSMIF